jgi:DNA-binding CsgD family transcriptional regulator
VLRRGDTRRAESLVAGKDQDMPQIAIDILTPVVSKFVEGTTLTPAERSEVLRLAQGFACKDSAAAAGVSPETIRARRKRIYRKLGMPGANELTSSILALSLKMLRDRLEEQPAAPAPSASVAGSP